MAIAIRRATPLDQTVIAEFNQLMALETEGKELDRDIVSAGVEAALKDPTKAWYFLAHEGEEVVGQLMITFEWSDWRNGWIWWIQSVYVRSDTRRRGVFRALFDHIRTAAVQTPGIAGIRLYVEQDNEIAQRTYERLGLDATGYLVMERCPP